MKKLSDYIMQPVIQSMATLNKTAAEVMIKIGVNACTDITGFGLIGHASEIAQMSKVSLAITVSKLPLFKAAEDFARESIMSGGSFSNKDYYGPLVKIEPGIPQEIQDICFDAQTSGGLLMTVAKTKADAIIKELHKQGVKDATIIGEVVDKQEKSILLSK
jgi:selenide,water dikinase